MLLRVRSGAEAIIPRGDQKKSEYRNVSAPLIVKARGRCLSVEANCILSIMENPFHFFQRYDILFQIIIYLSEISCIACLDAYIIRI
jgi:hypothetical protein